MEQNQKQTINGTEKTPEAIIMEIAETAEHLGAKEQFESVPRKPLAKAYHRLNKFMIGFSRIKLADKVTFFQLLAVMLNAGVPLIRSLYTLEDQFRNPRFKKVVLHIAQKVEQGMRLSDTMSDYPQVFSEAQIGMVGAGEASGNMNEVLTQTAKQLETTASLIAKVRGAMMYPIAIFCLLIIVSALMIVYIVPRITVLFEGTNMTLPMITRVVIALSDILRNHGFSVIVMIFLVVFIIFSWGKTPNGRYHLDRFKLRLPVFGKLLRHVSLARFARTLSSLVISGIPIVKALQICAESIGNAVYRERIFGVAEDVQRGIRIAENLGADSLLFPETVVNMVAIGEETAQLDTILSKIADFYEERVDIMTNSLAKLLEPLIMICLGTIVGGVVLAILMPMIQLTDLADLV